MNCKKNIIKVICKLVKKNTLKSYKIHKFEKKIHKLIYLMQNYKIYICRRYYYYTKKILKIKHDNYKLNNFKVS